MWPAFKLWALADPEILWYRPFSCSYSQNQNLWWDLVPLLRSSSVEQPARERQGCRDCWWIFFLMGILHPGGSSCSVCKVVATVSLSLWLGVWHCSPTAMVWTLDCPDLGFPVAAASVVMSVWGGSWRGRVPKILFPHSSVRPDVHFLIIIQLKRQKVKWDGMGCVCTWVHVSERLWSGVLFNIC